MIEAMARKRTGFWAFLRRLFRSGSDAQTDCEKKLTKALDDLQSTTIKARKRVDRAKRVINERTRRRDNPFDLAELARKEAARRNGNGSSS